MHYTPMDIQKHNLIGYKGKSSFVFEFEGVLVTKDLEPVARLVVGWCENMSFNHPPDVEHFAQDEAVFVGNVRLRRLAALQESS